MNQDQELQQYSSKSNVMIGCGCRNVKDVAAFIKERRIENVDLAWADEMGLWHTETVPVSELTYAHLQEGVPCKDGRFLLPDPLSARFAPLTQPSTMIFTCNPTTARAALKTRQLNPGWIEMISKKLMENDKRTPSPLNIEKLLNGADQQSDDPSYSPRSDGGTDSGGPSKFSSLPDSPSHHISNSLNNSGGVPLTPQDRSPSTSPTISSPLSPLGNSTLPPGGSGGAGIGSNSGFIEWKIVRNDNFGTSPPTLVFPPSPPSDVGSTTPPGSVPGSPCMPSSPHSPVPDVYQETDASGKSLHVPPLLRPRQIHPTKANKLGISKVLKKRRNTEHLYCRHCGTTETPEWRRGPDGRKSLCNACGLYFSKMIKRETLVVPQGRRVAIDALLNP